MPRIRRPSRMIVWVLEQITEVPYTALFGIWAGIVVCFAVLYFALSFLPGEQSLSGLSLMEPLRRLGNSLYFSVITSTTVGYGDLAPRGLSKVFAATEAVFAYFVFAVFTAKLLSYKSDLAIREVHGLMFESKFHRTREGFYTIRKDFDAILKEADGRHALSEDTWDKLAIASWDGQRLLEGILPFYSEQRDFTSLDLTEEKLLLEAVHRTYARLQRVIGVLDAGRIAWGKTAAKELHDLLRVTADLLPQWKHVGHRANAEWFQRVEILTKELLGSLPAKTKHTT